jgi:hypothetical protein
MSLGTGEAILFSPNGLAARLQKADDQTNSRLVPTHIGQGYLIVRSRLRVTRDGGHSILAVHNPALSSPLLRPLGDADEPSAPPVVRPASRISSHPGSVTAHCSHPYLDNISDADDTPDPDRSQAAETVEEGSSSLQTSPRLPAFLKQKWKAFDEQCERSSSVREAQISVDEQIDIALQHVDEEEGQITEHDTWRDVTSSECHRATLVSTSLGSTTSSPIPANTNAFTGPVADVVQAPAATGHPASKSLHSHLVRIVTREGVCDWTKLWWLKKKHKDEFGKQSLHRFIQGCVDNGLVRRVNDTHIALPDAVQPIISDAVSGSSQTSALPSTIEPTGAGAPSSQHAPVRSVDPEPERKDADTDDGSDIDDAALQPVSSITSTLDVDVASVAAFCRSEHAAGNAQLGLTYVRTLRLRPPSKSKTMKLARLRAAMTAMASRGLIDLHTTPLGEWLFTPGTPPRLYAHASALQAGARSLASKRRPITLD